MRAPIIRHYPAGEVFDGEFPQRPWVGDEAWIEDPETRQRIPLTVIAVSADGFTCRTPYGGKFELEFFKPS